MSTDHMDTPRCVAIAKSTGTRCKRRPIPFGTVCVKHGGGAPAVRAAAERRRAEQQATALLETVWNPDAPPVTNVVEALHQMAGRLEHSVNVLGARLATEDLDSPAGLGWYRVLREQRQLLADIARLGIAEKHIELEQSRAELVVVAVRAGLATLPGLLPDERDRFLRAFLGSLGRDVEAAPGQVVAGELG